MAAYIEAIAYYLPERVVTNEELAAEFPEWSAEKIFKKVGVRARHVAGDDETATDMAARAAENLFAAGIARERVDFVILCTQSPDYHLPPSACLLQHRLGLRENIGALDIDLGCSGYVYGLSLARGLIAGGMADTVLLLTAETYNKYIHPTDKGNRTIFGDGAAATLVTADSTRGRGRIEGFVFGTSGAGATGLIVPNGCARSHLGAPNHIAEKPIDHPDNIYMDGADIFSFTLKAVPELVKEVLAKNGDTLADIDTFVFHQANKYMLDFLAKKIGIPAEKMYINLEIIGNTVSSTIPIALKDAADDGKLAKGSKALLAGFGVGLSWAGVEVYF